MALDIVDISAAFADEAAQARSATAVMSFMINRFCCLFDVILLFGLCLECNYFVIRAFVHGRNALHPCELGLLELFDALVSQCVVAWLLGIDCSEKCNIKLGTCSVR